MYSNMCEIVRETVTFNTNLRHYHEECLLLWIDLIVRYVLSVIVIKYQSWRKRRSLRESISLELLGGFLEVGKSWKMRWKSESATCSPSLLIPIITLLSSPVTSSLFIQTMGKSHLLLSPNTPRLTMKWAAWFFYKSVTSAVIQNSCKLLI